MRPNRQSASAAHRRAANAALDLAPARQMLKGGDQKPHSKKIGATANYSPMAADGLRWYS
jgi:hypothetical protein